MTIDNVKIGYFEISDENKKCAVELSSSGELNNIDKFFRDNFSEEFVQDAETEYSKTQNSIFIHLRSGMKRCPCCAGKDLFLSSTWPGTTRCSVWCDDCGMDGPEANDIETAKRLWNRRRGWFWIAQHYIRNQICKFKWWYAGQKEFGFLSKKGS